MKRENQSRNIRFIKILMTVIGLTMFLSACSKSDIDETLTGEARVMVVNAASGSTAQDFYLENVKLNATGVAYTQNTAYTKSAVGYGRKGEFKDANSATPNFTGYVDILPDRKYTVFYTNKADGNGYSAAVFPDELVNNSTTKARLRFINLTSNMSSANFLITGGATLASNVAFANSTVFSDVEPGTVSFQAAPAGGGTAAVNLGNFTLQAGKIYTIYTSGSLSGTVSASLLTHN